MCVLRSTSPGADRYEAGPVDGASAVPVLPPWMGCGCCPGAGGSGHCPATARRTAIAGADGRTSPGSGGCASAALKAPSREEIQRRESATFYAALPSAGGALDAVAKIHGAASTHGVLLSHGEYRLVRDGSARLWRYQISLPARASYPHLRAWLADTLSAVPSASLDELSLRRADSSGDVVEALVRLTLYMRAD